MGRGGYLFFVFRSSNGPFVVCPFVTSLFVAGVLLWLGPFSDGTFCDGPLCDGTFCDRSFSDGPLCTVGVLPERMPSNIWDMVEMLDRSAQWYVISELIPLQYVRHSRKFESAAQCYVNARTDSLLILVRHGGKFESAAQWYMMPKVIPLPLWKVWERSTVVYDAKSDTPPTVESLSAQHSGAWCQTWFSAIVESWREQHSLQCFMPKLIFWIISNNKNNILCAQTISPAPSTPPIPFLNN